MKQRNLLFSIVLLLALYLSAINSAYSQGLTPDDVVSIQTVGAVAMSPNGQHVAYTLSVPRTEQEMRGRNFSELYLLPASGGDPISVIGKPNSAGSPQWGTDGRLYFTARLSDQHAQTQVYSVNASGSDLRRHTAAEYGVSSYSWNRDGSTIAYTSMDPISAERRAEIERGFDMIVAGENLRYMRLWVQPANGEAVQISPEEAYVWDFSWDPNGSRLAIRISDRPGADEDQLFTRIAVIGADGSGMEEWMAAPKKKAAMSWSPDGTRLAVLAGKVFSDPLPQRLWIIDTETGAMRDYTPEEWEGTIESMSWMDDRTVAF
ncbi:MAG: hypothetical protein ACNA78_11970, partial [Balneolaceae bacterium]